MRQKNLYKSKTKFEILQTWFAVRTRVRNNYSRKCESVSFFPTSFALILSAVAFPIVLKAEFNFEVICTLPFLFSKVQAAALNPLSVFNTLLKAHRSPCFRRGWGKEKLFTRKVWGLRSPWSSILRPPKHRLMFFLSILNAKCRFRNENKTLEVCRFGPQSATISCTFRARVWRQKRSSSIAQNDRVSLKFLTRTKLNLLFGYR